MTDLAVALAAFIALIGFFAVLILMAACVLAKREDLERDRLFREGRCGGRVHGREMVRR